MGWSEQDEQLAQEIQARVDKETSALKEQIAALTKERYCGKQDINTERQMNTPVPVSTWPTNWRNNENSIPR